jgi:glycine dehydrogenase
MDRADNPLKHAPHPASVVAADVWAQRYPRTLAAYPDGVDANAKYWPPVARVDNVYGDRHLFCSCIPVTADDALEEAAVVGTA